MSIPLSPNLALYHSSDLLALYFTMKTHLYPVNFFLWGSSTKSHIHLNFHSFFPLFNSWCFKNSFWDSNSVEVDKKTFMTTRQLLIGHKVRQWIGRPFSTLLNTLSNCDKKIIIINNRYITFIVLWIRSYLNILNTLSNCDRNIIIINKYITFIVLWIRSYLNIINTKYWFWIMNLHWLNKEFLFPWIYLQWVSSTMNLFILCHQTRSTWI